MADEKDPIPDDPIEWLQGEFGLNNRQTKFVMKWAKDGNKTRARIEPGQPNQNAYIERFNRSYRTEVLNVYLFSNLEEVPEITWRWMLEYNEERDHDSLGKMTPVEFYQNAGLSTFELSS